MISVDHEECVGCESCMTVCPVDAIFMLHERAQINRGVCTECCACVDECPVEAIRVETVANSAAS